MLPSERGLVQVFVYLSSDDVDLRETLEVAIPARLTAPALATPEVGGGGGGRSLATPLLIVLGVSLLLVVGLRIHMVTRERGLRMRARTSGLAPADGIASLEAQKTPRAQWENEDNSLEDFDSVDEDPSSR